MALQTLRGPRVLLINIRLMKHFSSGAELAKEMGISAGVLADTFSKYNEIARSKKDPFGKKYFHNVPFDINDSFWVAIISKFLTNAAPVLHFTMGGIQIDEHSQVLSPSGPVQGLFAVCL